ncbi:MAG: nitroreductase family protein [bacterium]|nr:nitroreductase family protein [bacterium]
MDVYDAILTRRTIRRYQQKPIDEKILEKLINAARVAPSAANLQPCEYIIVNEKSIVDRIFPCLKWAGYIAPAGNPPEGERPVAYIIVLLNRTWRKEGGEVDAAAAIENILLTALEEGIASCWLGSVDRAQVRQILSIPDYCIIDSVIALGYPNEQSVVEEMFIPSPSTSLRINGVEGQDSVKYWKDDSGLFHVPKRKLGTILHKNKY